MLSWHRPDWKRSLCGWRYSKSTARKLLAKSQAEEKIVAVLTKPVGCEGGPPTILERTLFWRYFHRHEWMLDRLWEAAQSYGQEVAQMETMAEESPHRALIIAPEKTPPAKFITRDRRKINRTINMGYRQALAMITERSSFCSCSDN